MSDLRLAVISDGPPTLTGLAAAAERAPGVSTSHITPGQPILHGVDGIVLDLLPARRLDALAALPVDTPIPILTEAPFAPTLESAQRFVAEYPEHRITSLNPLAYHTPIRRLVDLVTSGGDPLQTFFTAWRFPPSHPWDQALAQLASIAASLAGGTPARISAIRRTSPGLLLAILRYDNGVVGSLEIGAHLPPSADPLPELLIECFCRDHVYQCRPDTQVISVETGTHSSLPWAPDPADAMLATFLTALRGGRFPDDGLADDLATLAISEDILAAAR